MPKRSASLPLNSCPRLGTGCFIYPKRDALLRTNPEGWQKVAHGRTDASRFAMVVVLVAATLMLWTCVGRAADDPANTVPVSVTNESTTASAEQPEESDGTTNAAAVAEHRATIRRDAIVEFRKDVELKRGEEAEVIVVIGGSAKIHGKVRDAVVVVGGNVEVDGEVGDAVVAVLGNITVTHDADIKGDVVAVGGHVETAEGAKIGGQVNQVDLEALGFHNPEWVRQWFAQCVLRVRPLAPGLQWTWAVAGVFFLFYLLVALAVPRPVSACVAELSSRPATTLLMGFLTELLLPLVLLILAITGIGLLVIPFLLAALFLAAIVGKVALLEWIGSGLGMRTGVGAVQKAPLALFAGAVIITLLYFVPILGLAVFLLAGVWGFGAAVLAAAGGLRRERPEKRPPASPGPSADLPSAPPSPPGTGVGAPSGLTASSVPPVMNPDLPSAAQAAVASAAPVPVPDVLAYPRAGFWQRMAAGSLDIILVSILGAMTGLAGLWLIFLLAYFTGLWCWQGTTVGGIVLGLKVVRYDGQALTFVQALVRALAAAFSVMILFLGFLWIAWDKDSLAWHDMIAGTVVLRVPKSKPLV